MRFNVASCNALWRPARWEDAGETSDEPYTAAPLASVGRIGLSENGGGSDVSGGLFFFICAAVVFAALGLADQRKLWRRMWAKWFHNPETSEPSDAGLTRLRVFYFVFAALMVFAGWQMQKAENDYDRTVREREKEPSMWERETNSSWGLGKDVSAWSPRA